MLGFIRDYFIQIWSIFFKKNNPVPALSAEKEATKVDNKKEETLIEKPEKREENDCLSVKVDSVESTAPITNTVTAESHSPQTLKKIKAVNDFHTEFKISKEDSSESNLSENNDLSAEIKGAEKKFQLGNQTPQNERAIDFSNGIDKDHRLIAKTIGQEAELQPIKPIEFTEKKTFSDFSYIKTDLKKENSDQQELRQKRNFVLPTLNSGNVEGITSVEENKAVKLEVVKRKDESEEEEEEEEIEVEVDEELEEEEEEEEDSLKDRNKQPSVQSNGKAETEEDELEEEEEEEEEIEVEEEQEEDTSDKLYKNRKLFVAEQKLQSPLNSST